LTSRGDLVHLDDVVAIDLLDLKWGAPTVAWRHADLDPSSRAIAAFVSAWRAKWRPRTDCRPGYIVETCRQFKPAPGEPPEDPYSLN
jgi:hypothetical protein